MSRCKIYYQLKLITKTGLVKLTLSVTIRLETKSFRIS